MEGCVAETVGTGRVCAFLEEKVEDNEIAGKAPEEVTKRRLAGSTFGVDISSVFDEQLNNVGAFYHAVVQRLRH